MLRILSALGLFTALTALCGLAGADDNTPGGKKRGAMLQNPEKIFRLIDRNRDGKISKNEFKAFLTRLAPARVKDKPEMVDRVFERADKDGDGYLSLSEFKDLVARFRDQQAGQKKKPDQPPDP
jgi:hypothetical protein